MPRRTLVPLALAAAGCVALPAVALAAPVNAVLPVPASAAAPPVATATVKPPTRAGITVLPAVDVVNEPVGITDAGLVVGNAGPAGGTSGNSVDVTTPKHPWRWIAGRLQRLPTGGAVQAKIDDVNRLGATSGWSSTTADPNGVPQNERAAQWDLLGRSRPVSVAAIDAPALNDQGDLLLDTDTVPPGATGSLDQAVLSAEGTEIAVDPTFDYPLGSSGLLLTNSRDVVYAVGGAGGTVYLLRWRVGSSTPGFQVGYGFPRLAIPACVSANDQGIVASSGTSADTGRLVIHVSRPDGTGQDLPLAGNALAHLGCGDVIGHSVNARGDVTGEVWSSSDPSETTILPAIWHGGVLRILGDSGSQGSGKAVNDYSQVAGTTFTGRFGEPVVQTPVLWTGTSTLKLPLPSGWSVAAVTQVNNRGQVLGAIRRTTESGTLQVRAVVWTTS
jgi:hypothetical protein